jgi:hypothetical protein
MTRANAEQFIAGELSDLPEKYLACRDLRHTWRVQENFTEVEMELEGTGVKKAVERILECPQCGTTRTDTYLLIERANHSPRLEKWATTYGYPNGYQMKRGQLPRDLAVSQLVRYETLRRVLAMTGQS